MKSRVKYEITTHKVMKKSQNFTEVLFFTEDGQFHGKRHDREIVNDETRRHIVPVAGPGRAEPGNIGPYRPPVSTAALTEIAELDEDGRSCITLVWHTARQPCHPGKSCICGFSHVGLEQHIAWHPYVTVSDHFQIAPQDRDVSAVIRVTSTVSVTAVNCTVTLKYIHFCTYVTLMNIRSTTTTATTMYVGVSVDCNKLSLTIINLFYTILIRC